MLLGMDPWALLCNSVCLLLFGYGRRTSRLSELAATGLSVCVKALDEPLECRSS